MGNPTRREARFELRDAPSTASSATTSLCTTCGSLDLRSMVDEEEVTLDEVVLQPSLAALQRSSATCCFCCLAHDELSRIPALGLLDDAARNERPVILRCVYRSDMEEDEGVPQGLYGIKVRCGMEYTILGVYLDEKALADPSYGSLASFIVAREIKPPRDRMTLLQDWISRCEQEHPECRTDAVTLPTRVVDVGSETCEPRLVVTSGKKAHYLALSHCWGTNPLIRTTKSTLEQHKLALPMAMLPKTFREAIEVTRSLGVQYIWIDSLCIVQDDARDWELESAKMGFVYSSSFLTIAAAASKDSTGGLFVPRSRARDIVIKCSANKIQRRKPKTLVDVFVRPPLLDFETLKTRNLHTRGWVAQERMLSRRMIHFDADQLLWECRRTRVGEDGIPSEVWNSMSSVWDERLHASYPVRTRQFITDWYYFVSDFSEKNFTKAEDKLPAISGVAQTMAKRTKNRYIAGVWREYFIAGLLWRRDGSWLTQPVAGYRAPSWSWASVDGKIDFDHPFPSTTSEPESQVQYEDAAMRPAAEVLEADTTPLGLDPFGRLSSGFISIRGRLKRAPPRNPRVAPSSNSSSVEELLDPDNPSVGLLLFDEEGTCRAGEEIYCLELAHKRYVAVEFRGLILVPTGAKDEYKRVGMVRGPGPGSMYSIDWTNSAAGRWFADVPVVTIRVV